MEFFRGYDKSRGQIGLAQGWALTVGLGIAWNTGRHDWVGGGAIYR